MVKSILSAGILCLAASLATAQTTPPARSFDTIEVTGNGHFRDGDILATSGLKPGQPYTEDDLRAAVTALEFTGEFRHVRIYSRGKTLHIVVNEQPTSEGALTFGLGLDTDTGLFGSVDLRLDNAFGTGAQLHSTALLSKDEQEASLSLFDPDLISPTIGAGLRLDYGKYTYDEAAYAYERISVAPFLRIKTGAASSLEARFEIAQAQITDVDPAASPILQAEAGKEQIRAIGLTYSYGAVDPTATQLTWAFVIDAQHAGFGGDAKFNQTTAALSGHLPLPQGFALRSHLELGQVSGRGGYTPRVTERFVLGGASLRGFARGTIGPKDVTATGSTGLGGTQFAALRTDLLLPLFDNRAIDTFVFADTGSVWGLDNSVPPAGTLDKSREMRRSAGVGASVETGFGRLEAYYALKAEGPSEDDRQAFGLTFRSEF